MRYPSPPSMLIKLLLSGYLLGSVVIGQAQGENSITKNLLSLSKQSLTKQSLSKLSLPMSYHSKSLSPDTRALGERAMQAVDSISHTKAASSHFAWIYCKVMANLDLQLREMDSLDADFILKFEIAFADYFLQACIDDKNGKLSASSPWKNLFSNSSAHSLKLTIMGISAHVNGDIWQAFVNNFSGEEIRLHKKAFLNCQSSVSKVYNSFFDSVAAQSWYLQFMRAFTKGLVKNLGERIIYKWRRRQVNLAIMYFQDHERFKKRLQAVNRKKETTDQLILHRISLIIPKDGIR